MIRTMDVAWLNPWQPVESENVQLGLVAELHRELPTGHVLVGARVTAIARRDDCDDVLFALDDGRVAVVHLMFSGSAGPNRHFPTTRFFDSLNHFVEDEMKREHRKWREK